MKKLSAWVEESACEIKWVEESACEINCGEVVFWSSIQQLLVKTHSIQFYAF